MNWLKGAHPVKAQGMGGRQVRTGNEYGEIFDHHYVEYQYPDGTYLNSQCRHQKGCMSNWSDAGQGVNGTFNCIPGRQLSYIYDKNGNQIWKYDGSEETEPHQVEQTEFFRMLRQDEYINQAESGAESTMTAIMGRMATYSGQLIEWDKAMESNKNMQQELVKEKALLDSLMAYLPDLVYFKDRESKFIRISQSMKKLFTVDNIDEMVGKSDFDFQTKEAAEQYYNEEQEIIKTNPRKIHFIS